ncbi:hypothetical protein [Desulfitobacterium dichloroeliminans]|uniref:hypothetical protein n=1 Tax=Desulfitobacterium dichloroeliminans TaxID=233055 RepID=UPI000318390F|nr:hypothetical protein [Desulfitobacterium dichloroeliminans]
MGGWKRPVSNPTPLRAFREERVAARLEAVLYCQSKSLGNFYKVFGNDSYAIP